MKQLYLKGCGTALVTPFENSEVDYLSLSKLIKYQILSGIDFLVPLGSTAETACLEDDEKIKIVELTKKIVTEHKAPIPIVAGVGTNSLKHTIRNIELIERCDFGGVDAYLVVVPYYNKPTQEGIYQYFKAVATSTDKAIVLYNVPGRTGINMSAEIVLRLANDVDNIVAIKEASGNKEQIKKIISSKPQDFSFLSGNDDEVLDCLKFGGEGIISVASNIAPVKEKALFEAFHAGNPALAQQIFEQLSPLYEACFVESNPIPVKAALHLLSYINTNQMRLPLTPALESTVERMQKVIKDLGLS